MMLAEGGSGVKGKGARTGRAAGDSMVAMAISPPVWIGIAAEVAAGRDEAGELMRASRKSSIYLWRFEGAD